MPTDVELMLQVKDGDLEKLGLLFEKYKKFLFAYFFRFSVSQQTSEDLVQNVFFRMLKYRHNYSGKGKFTTWMYSIAHNLVIDHYHKNKKYVEEEDIDSKPDCVDTIDRTLVTKEEMDLLQQAFQKLKPHEKEVLILAKYQNLTYKEVGSILDCAEGTVKAKVFRAVQSLKSNYNTLER